MRPYLIFVVLLLMLGAYGAHVHLRGSAPHQRPGAGTAVGSGSAASSKPSGKGSTAAKAGKGKEVTKKVIVRKLMKRPLRVTSLGWEALVPALVANRGLTPSARSLCSAEGLDLHLAVADRPADVESALARGGADAAGADVALLPLPGFVAALERMRALAPQLFFLAAWSTGREALESTSDKALVTPPRTEVKLVGAAGESPTFFALFLLDLAGVPPSRVRLVPPTDAKAHAAPLAAVERKGRDEAVTTPTRRLLVTTADASRLIPIVAVAPGGFIRGHEEALVAWSRCWLAGVQELQADVPAAARQVAALKGAPPVLELLGRLGQQLPSTLRDNARAFGLAGRGAVTLEPLFQRAYRLWREAGALTAPPPEHAPLAGQIVAELVRRDPTMAEVELPRRPAKLDEAALAAAKVLLVRGAPATRLDPEAFAADVGFVAGVFERSPIRVGARDSVKAKRVVSSARSRFDLTERVFVGAKAARAPAAIEVLAAP